MERVIDPENMQRAYRKMVANKGAPGVDGMTVFVDDVPMVPGPSRIDGPLDISIETGPGVDATIDRIALQSPTSAESEVIDRWRSSLEPSISFD